MPQLETHVFCMTGPTRRTILASVAAVAASRALPRLAAPATRRILVLVRDRAAGGLRAVEKVVPR